MIKFHHYSKRDVGERVKRSSSEKRLHWPRAKSQKDKDKIAHRVNFD